MIKETLEKYLDQGISQRKIAAIEGISQTNVRYWLNKYDLKVVYNRKGQPHNCKGCGETNPAKFYGHKRSYCGSCHNDYAVERTRKQKLKIVDYMGGSCNLCGFNAWVSALEVHHLEPETKDPLFGSFTSWKWSRIIEELKRCVLLCSNCHAGVHTNNVKITDIDRNVKWT